MGIVCIIIFFILFASFLFVGVVLSPFSKIQEVEGIITKFNTEILKNCVMISSTSSDFQNDLQQVLVDVPMYYIELKQKDSSVSFCMEISRDMYNELTKKKGENIKIQYRENVFGGLLAVSWDYAK